MSWSLFRVFVSSGVEAQLTRIADALERIAPELPQPEPLQPEEAVSYVDEEKIAQQELAEEMGELERMVKAQEEALNEDKGDNVFSQSHPEEH